MSSMYLANVRGLGNLARQKPQLVPVAALNLQHRLSHKLRSARDLGWSHPPEQLTVMVTDLCNLRCKMCQYTFTTSPGYQLNQSGYMDPAIFYKLMDEIPGRPIVALTGGEPLLHPCVTELIAYAKSKQRICVLTTNGWKLAERARDLCDAGLDVLVVSVDGPSETHNEIRGGKSFERLAKGLEVLLVQPDRPVVFLSMAVSDLNYDQVDQVYEYARQMGLYGMNINHLWMQTDEMVKSHNFLFPDYPADRITWQVNPENIEVEKLAHSLTRIRAKNRGSQFILAETPYLDRDELAVWYQQPEKPVKWQSTRCAWMRMKVWPDGKVKPCRKWHVGNISEQHAMEIWNNEQYRRFRRHLLTDGTLSICARCCYLANR